MEVSWRVWRQRKVTAFWRSSPGDPAGGWGDAGQWQHLWQVGLGSPSLTRNVGNVHDRDTCVTRISVWNSNDLTQVVS